MFPVHYDHVGLFCQGLFNWTRNSFVHFFFLSNRGQFWECSHCQKLLFFFLKLPWSHARRVFCFQFIQIWKRTNNIKLGLLIGSYPNSFDYFWFCPASFTLICMVSWLKHEHTNKKGDPTYYPADHVYLACTMMYVNTSVSTMDIYFSPLLVLRGKVQVADNWPFFRKELLRHWIQQREAICPRRNPKLICPTE